VGFEQFLCFEMAVGADALVRPDHLDQLPCEVRRKFDHSTVIQQQPVYFATWIKEVLRDRAFHLRRERLLAGPVWSDPEFVFHFLYPVFGKADFCGQLLGYTDLAPMHADVALGVRDPALAGRSLGMTGCYSLDTGAEKGFHAIEG
jgi:hypothetical protein